MVNALAGNVSIRFGLKGANIATATACATGSHAIGAAFHMIQRGDVDAMVAGGSEGAVTPLCVGSFAAMKALSTRNDAPTKASRPFDRDRDGFRDGDERAACSDPADPRSTPDSTCRFDIAGDDGRIDGQDLAVVLNAWGSSDPVADVDCTGGVDGADLAMILNAWGVCQ
jgi:hypothetical protein